MCACYATGKNANDGENVGEKDHLKLKMPKLDQKRHSNVGENVRDRFYFPQKGIF